MFKFVLISGASMGERVRACPPFRRAHCVEPGVVNLIPLAANWSCPECICVIKIVLVWCRLMDLCLLRRKSSVHVTVKWNK